MKKKLIYYYFNYFLLYRVIEQLSEHVQFGLGGAAEALGRFPLLSEIVVGAEKQRRLLADVLRVPVLHWVKYASRIFE